MIPARIEVPFNGQSFFIDIAEGNMVSLNRIYEISGQPDGKHDPRRWKDKAGKDFIEFVAQNLNVPTGDIYKTKRGKHTGGSWAHWQIALAYAKLTCFIQEYLVFLCTWIIQDFKRLST